ncbi:MAG: Serine/threonine phosphatase stp [Chlamydiia bacterium]|nr:Serine/threonine phosphatase stp [Chlamydiia bacterium]
MPLFSVQHKSFGISDRGLVRPNNEDVYLERPEDGYFLLADGMGGHQAGEVASKEVVSYIEKRMSSLLSSGEPFASIESVAKQLKQLIENASSWVHYLGSSHDHLEGMGSTLCMMLFFQTHLICAHIGDSRIYSFRNGTLSQLTEDHSAYRRAEAGPYRVLTRAVGTQMLTEPEVSMVPVQLGDFYLMCSDGLSDLVSDQVIGEILSLSATIQEKSLRLVEEAKAMGGRDNITLVLVEVI